MHTFFSTMVLSCAFHYIIYIKLAMKRWQMFFHASFVKCGQDYSSIVHGTASTRIDQQRILFHSSFLGPIPWTLPVGTDCSSKILYRH